MKISRPMVRIHEPLNLSIGGFANLQIGKPLYDSFMTTSSTLLNRTTLYSGANFDHINALTEADNEDARAFAKQKYSASTFATLRNTDMNSLLVFSAVSDLMRGKELSSIQRKTLSLYSDYLDLPVHLSNWAALHMYLANLYGEPEVAIKNFADIYRETALPVLQKRMAKLGITPQHMQRVFQEDAEKAHPELRPVQALWFFSGIVTPTIELNDGSQALKLGLIKMARAISGSLPERYTFDQSEDLKRFDEQTQEIAKPGVGRDWTALQLILGINESEAARDYMLSKRQPLKVTQPVHEYMSMDSLFVGISPSLDAARSKILVKYINEQIAGVFDTPITEANADVLASMIRGSYLLQMYFSDAPKNFLKARTLAIQKKRTQSWKDVPLTLRYAFEDAGFTSAAALVDFINNEESQKRMTHHIGIIMRHTQDKLGYIITESDVLQALCSPQNARYADGAAIDPLYAKLHEIAATGAEFSSFYGLTVPERSTIRQLAVEEFYNAVMEAVRKDVVLRDIVTTEQLAELLELRPYEFTNLFDQPQNNYTQAKKNMQLVPSKAMDIIEKRLGVTFADGWVFIREEDLHKAPFRKAQAEIGEKPPQQVERVVDPWAGIPTYTAEMVRSKLGGMDKLVSAVEQQILSTAASPAKFTDKTRKILSGEIRTALQNFDAGFLEDGRPTDIVYARISKALGLNARTITRLFACDDSKYKPIDLVKRKVCANIVRYIVENPKLAHIVTTSQLKQESSKADLGALTDNLHMAFRVRTANAARPVLVAQPALLGIIEVLHRGVPADQRCEADAVVLCDEWQTAHKLKTGRDALPQGVRNYTIQCNL